MNLEQAFKNRWNADYWNESATMRKNYQSLNQKLFVESVERLVTIPASDMTNAHKRVFAMRALTEMKVAEKRGNLSEVVERLRLQLRKL